MSNAKGFAVQSPTLPLEAYNFERREPRENDVVVDIKYCGICHSDIHQARNEWGGANYPMVPGHEIVGIVSAVGNKVSKYKVGDTVGVGVFVDSCRQCTYCQQSLQQYCVEGMTGTYNGRERDGSGYTLGGYSSHIVVDENYILRIPNGLPLDKTAPLLCAGVTVYSPLKHWNAGPGKKVAILGLGGLGHMGVKIAHALGAEVTVLSHSLKKEEDGKRMGADHFYATSNPETFKKLHKYFDLIINTVSVELNWNEYVNLLAVDGAFVVVGLPEKPIPSLEVENLIRARRSLAGSMIGGIAETQEMLEFCAKHGITSDIELIPIQKVNEAYDRVVKSDVRYRFVIDMQSLKG